ncbi:hypothetical protein H5V44_13910 [Halobellus sp. MBLA0160]|uniref:Uncharacterized protein n=2 Tax=Halobellus ruber TaxID=2761102 RepID=A0A7J9SKB0_9EURY|nr:hypothetical protein [Halobellus ruber]
MRQLRTCEFCGADAAGVYEVLPPALSPTEAEQRRIVLCSDCAGTLETVIDPLLERLGVEADDDASGVDAGDESEDSSTAAASSATGGSAAAPGDGAGSDAADSHTDATPPDDPGGEPVQWSDPDRAGGGADDAGHPRSEPIRDGIPNVDPATDTDSPAATEAGAGTGGAATDADGSAADGADDTDDDRATGTEAAGSDDGPEEFRTVMRLLGNREFPVERTAIVELAASAYDLDEGHVHRIVDHAVDRGVIVDDGGTLRRN